MATKEFRQASTGESVIRVANPTAVSTYTPVSPAPRLKDLTGKKIGLHWNNKARGDAALNRVKERLSERFVGLSFEWFESAPNMGVSEEWFERVRQSGVAGLVGSTGD
jgi:hypothetical protein